VLVVVVVVVVFILIRVGRKFSVQWRICSGTDVQYQDTRYFEVLDVSPRRILSSNTTHSMALSLSCR